MAISTEKRSLLVLAKERNEKAEDIAKWLDISLPAIKQIWRIYRETGSILPKKNKGRTSSLTADMEIAIHDKIQNEPDSTLEEIIDYLVVTA